MLLSPLFYQCLHIPYTQVGVTANFALQRKGRTLYIYFQASDGKNDWKNNLDFPAKPYKRMGKTVWFAHRGFLKVWKEIEPYLIQEIADTHYQSFVVVGYSHGAAIAALCHEYIWYNRPDAREDLLGYGFGSPRVLWGICHKAVKNRWARYTVIRNENDLITHLPPAFLGFSHVGSMLKIGKKGNYSPVQAHYPENIMTELIQREKDQTL